MPIIPEPDVPDPICDLACLICFEQLKKRRAKKDALNAQIDKNIAAVDVMLHARAERRVLAGGHEPERRGGFDRRARVLPVKP